MSEKFVVSLEALVLAKDSVSLIHGIVEHLSELAKAIETGQLNTEPGIESIIISIYTAPEEETNRQKKVDLLVPSTH